MKRVLELGAYRRLFATYTLNELAWAFGSLALSFLVYRRTGSAVGAAAFYIASQFIPALLAPMLVARVDHRHPRAVLPALYGGEGVLFAALGVLAIHAPIALVLGLALLDGTLALTARPLARAITVGVTKPAGLLREGNAMLNASFSVCFMAGPALGGAVVATGGARAALFVNTGLFAAIALTLVSSRQLPEARGERAPAAGRVRAALHHIRRQPGAEAILSLQAVAVLFFTLTVPVEVVYAEHSLHAGATGYGILLSSWGAGAVVGSAIYARWRARESLELIGFGALMLGLGFIATAVAPTLAVAAGGSAIAGVGNGIETIAARTALQERTGERWMAIVMSFADSLYPIMTGVGIVIGGAIAALAGPRAALASAGCGALVITATVWLVLRAAGAAAAGASPAPVGAGASSSPAGAGASSSPAGAGASSSPAGAGASSPPETSEPIATRQAQPQAMEPVAR